MSSHISRCVRLQENRHFQLVNLLQPATGTQLTGPVASQLMKLLFTSHAVFV